MNLAASFGDNAEAYDRGRPKHAQEVIDYVLFLINGRVPILDVGCGTGVATRQLAERIYSICGCDPHKAMIQIAKERHPSGEYYVASANSLPFESAVFAAVTAFSSFHWFCNSDSAQEIKRVLRPGGVFAAVTRSQKKEEGVLDYERVIAELRGTSLSFEESVEYVRANYKPLEVLTEAGFSAVSKREFSIPQKIPIEQEMDHLKTRSYLLAIPESERSEILQKLEARLRAEFSSGYIHRTLDPFVVSGRKYLHI